MRQTSLTLVLANQFAGFQLKDQDPVHEQRGIRPCIVVSDLEVIAEQRFPLVCVVPITGKPGEGLLYPDLAFGKNGLAKKSFATDRPTAIHR